MEHRGEVDQVWFSPNSQFLATLSLASIVIIWDAATGYQVTPPLQHGDAVADARFSPDARVLLTTVRAGGAWLWRLEALPSSAEDVAALAQYLAGHRIDETGALIALDRSELKAAAGLVEKRIPTELASDGEELRIWHLDELAACEASRRWADALSQVAWLRLAEPTNWEHAARQAFAHANLGQWAGAIASFERSLQLGADPGRLLPFLADAQLAEGSTNGYRTTCARLLEAAARERSASLTNLAAWVCALAPNASEITRTALEWAQATMTDQPADVAALATLGALLYRVGRFGEARAVLEKAAPNQTASGNTCAALFLAMACLRTGESKVAESQLVEAQVEMARRRASAGDRALDRSAVSWEQAVEFELVAAEASRELGRAVKRVE
jgi:tetratricopeptide (TPR) repeat protein